MAKAKAKDTAKEAPKARTSKAKEKAAEKALLAGALTEAPAPMDAEARREVVLSLLEDAMMYLGTARPCIWCEILQHRN